MLETRVQAPAHEPPHECGEWDNFVRGQVEGGAEREEETSVPSVDCEMGNVEHGEIEPELVTCDEW